MITLGTALYAFGINFFLLPHHLLEGGVTGIAILLNYAFSWPISLMTLLLNIPIFLIGLKALGWKSMFYSIYGVLSLSFFLFVAELVFQAGYIQPFDSKENILLATLYAGVILGFGIGTVFRFGGTTGGVDIIAAIISRKYNVRIGTTMLTIDFFILASALLVPEFSLEQLLYTLVYVFVASKMIDLVQEGIKSSRSFQIFTDKPRAISKAIHDKLNRGTTLYEAQGGYTGKHKQVVFVVITRNEMSLLKRIIHKIDPKAFIVSNDVHEVLGEGFHEEKPKEKSPTRKLFGGKTSEDDAENELIEYTLINESTDAEQDEPKQ
jgi:uncharacterized membrane-anchored protein YitT (DUF2179 family)